MSIGNIKPIEFMARREEWDFGISLYSRQVTVGNGFYLAQPLMYEKIDQPGLIAEPFARLEIQAAQQLMDELWQCGLRPSEGTGSAGSLKATQDHLSDMQKTVYKSLKIG